MPDIDENIQINYQNLNQRSNNQKPLDKQLAEAINAIVKNSSKKQIEQPNQKQSA